MPFCQKYTPPNCFSAILLAGWTLRSIYIVSACSIKLTSKALFSIVIWKVKMGVKWLLWNRALRIKLLIVTFIVVKPYAKWSNRTSHIMKFAGFTLNKIDNMLELQFKGPGLILYFLASSLSENVLVHLINLQTPQFSFHTPLTTTLSVSYTHLTLPTNREV